MNYRETLFFIGKCLTITHDIENRKQITELIKLNKVDWDQIVQVSTSHYVFPALYGNLLRADLLSYLPDELVNYMKHITDLNRERNKQIIAQAREINELFQNNNIAPIFLKGTGFLLQNLYDGISDRMVGDIDFLVSEADFKKAINLLKKEGYNEKTILDKTFVNRHYTALIHPDKIAAVEVHHSMTSLPYHKRFNYNTVASSLLTSESTVVLSLENQLLLTIFNKQINDYGKWRKSIALRSTYDLYILSLRLNSLEAIEKFGLHFKLLNNFLASSQWILSTRKISYLNTDEVEKFKQQQLKFIENPDASKRNRKKWDLIFLTQNRLNIFLKLFYDKRARKYLFQRIFK